MLVRFVYGAAIALGILVLGMIAKIIMTRR
jgi:hypothetical protein